MFALPPKARKSRQRLFHQGRGIDKNLQFARLVCDDPTRENLQPGFDDIVVVRALCVDTDDAATAIF